MLGRSMNPKRGGICKDFVFFGSFKTKREAVRKEAQHPGTFIHEAHGRYYVLRPKSRYNPPQSKRLETIYKRVLSIDAQKVGFHRHCDAECKATGHKYTHSFRKGSKASLLAIPDGAYLVLANGARLKLSNGSMLVSDREY